MDNPVYRSAMEGLQEMYGPLSGWQSNVGVRTNTSPKGKITLYHDRIAPGNKAELAVDPESMARATSQGKDKAEAFVKQLAQLTGRATLSHARYKWPRIGLAVDSDVEAVLEALQTLFNEVASDALSSDPSPSYWWVSHNQMHRRELSGGYIWCPQTKKGGGARETWTNVSRVRRGDIVFSYAKTRLQAVGVALGDAQEASAPSEAYHSWNDAGWRVAIQWESLGSPLSPKEHWDEIGDLFPAVHSPLREDGGGNMTYLAALSVPLGLKLLDLIGMTDDDALANVDREMVKVSGVDKTEVERVYQARIGQGTYRKNVMSVERSCRVTGVSNVDLLIASHIRPWRQSSNQQRLDGNNGLLLSPHVDKLFDSAWISFSNQGEILVASGEVREVLIAWGIDPDMNVGRFNEDQEKYLAYHRDVLFSEKAKQPAQSPRPGRT
ncbi:HNH endonuclease [Achromobacter xylosoxidans]|nr:HNH endonuclease [Achromobacter xylosoxidans]